VPPPQKKTEGKGREKMPLAHVKYSSLSGKWKLYHKLINPQTDLKITYLFRINATAFLSM
jgi:hypothetical protein